MRILFVVPYVPTLIRTRPYNLIRGLARRGNAVTLATLWESEEERAALRELEGEGIAVIAARLTKPRSIWNSLRAWPTATPLQAVYCWQPALLRGIQSRLSASQPRFDVVHVEHLRGARYGLWIKANAPAGTLPPRRVWDSVDCISYLFEQAAQGSRSLFGRWVARLELERTQRYEGWLTGQFDRVLLTSPQDQAVMERLSSVYAAQAGSDAPTGKICVLPNGVDLTYFRPIDQPRAPRALVISGKMSYHANVTAALYLVNVVMPRVWAQEPEVRVVIVGKSPPRQVVQLARQHAPRVIVTGTVPDIRPALASAAIAVCPVRYGAGIQNKVLEAMAMGTPVVATPQAVSALHVREEEHLLVGADAESFAQAVLRLLADRELQRRLSQAGRQYVAAHHDWGRIVERLERLYTEDAALLP